MHERYLCAGSDPGIGRIGAKWGQFGLPVPVASLCGRQLAPFVHYPTRQAAPRMRIGPIPALFHCVYRVDSAIGPKPALYCRLAYSEQDRKVIGGAALKHRAANSARKVPIREFGE